jgi:hypothetical protein
MVDFGFQATPDVQPKKLAFQDICAALPTRDVFGMLQLPQLVVERTGCSADTVRLQQGLQIGELVIDVAADL